MGRVRLIIGVICIAIAVWIFLSGELGENPAPAIAVLGIGVILIVVARRKK